MADPAMMDLNRQLSRVYQQLGAPAAAKLHAEARAQGIRVTLKQAQIFVSKKPVQQIFKKTIRSKGHIAARGPDTNWQIDLVIKDSLKRSNDGMPAIFFACDIYTRKIGRGDGYEGC